MTTTFAQSDDPDDENSAPTGEASAGDPSTPGVAAPTPGWRRAMGASARLGRSAVRDLIPPEIWSTDRPCLAKQWAYAHHGEWGPKDGPARAAGLAYFWLVSLPVSVASYLAEWIAERPTRLVAAALLVLALWWAWTSK